MTLFVLLIALSFAAKQNKNIADSNGLQAENQIFVKIEENEYAKKKESSSQYIGVSYNGIRSKWQAARRSKFEKKIVCNGRYDNEETAAHASDTLARKLIANGEQGHVLNFDDDNTELFPAEKTFSSQYIGVTYDANGKWKAQRHSKHEKKMICNGSYTNEETAAHASDSLARKLMANGEHAHRLNFADNAIEVFPEEKTITSQYIGVSYNAKMSKWQAKRRSRHERKDVWNGCYDNDEKAARASDTLARDLITNGEQNHKLNFPDDDTKIYPKERSRKRKRPHLHQEDFGHPKNN